jgi:hypothetical protein
VINDVDKKPDPSGITYHLSFIDNKVSFHEVPVTCRFDGQDGTN